MTLGAILLLAAALACVATELFLPTHGVLAICAALLALGSIILAAKASPLLGVLFGLGVVIISPLVFYWAIRLYPSTPMGRRVMLRAPSAALGDSFEEDAARMGALVGKRGVTMTPLRLAGTVELNGDRVDCLSESGVIEAGATVEVIRVSGMKVIVKPL